MISNIFVVSGVIAVIGVILFQKETLEFGNPDAQKHKSQVLTFRFTPLRVRRTVPERFHLPLKRTFMPKLRPGQDRSKSGGDRRSAGGNVPPITSTYAFCRFISVPTNRSSLLFRPPLSSFQLFAAVFLLFFSNRPLFPRAREPPQFPTYTRDIPSRSLLSRA